MRSRTAYLVIAMVLGAASTALTPARCPAADAEQMISHDVYFALADNSAEAQEKLVAACQKYLSGHPGTIWFAAGPLAKEMEGELNDRDFGVALHLVFKNKAALDQYAASDRHQQFISEMKSAWQKVRVLDSYVTVSSHEGVDMGAHSATGTEKPAAAREMPALPDPAKGFAGMIRGKVVHKLDGRLLVKVAQIGDVWKHSAAKDAKSLIGKTVLVVAGEGSENVPRFVKLVKVGEEVTLDVAHKDGEVLTLLELTDEQRARVKEAAAEK